MRTPAVQGGGRGKRDYRSPNHNKTPKKGLPEMTTPYATSAERRQHDEDGGYTAALAVAHQLIARECYNLPAGLIAAPADQQFYATTGTIEERHAVVDAWAADHNVAAGWDEAVGMYSAKVRVGLSSMRASAVPVREPVSPAERDLVRAA